MIIINKKAYILYYIGRLRVWYHVIKIHLELDIEFLNRTQPLNFVLRLIHEWLKKLGAVPSSKCSGRTLEGLVANIYYFEDKCNGEITCQFYRTKFSS